MSEGRAVLGAAGVVQIRMIGEIEGLGAELQAHIFADRKIACQREIEVHEFRTGNNVAAGVSESVGGRKREAVDVEPLRDGFDPR